MQMQGTYAYVPTYEGKPFSKAINRFVGGQFAYHDAHQVDFLVTGEDGKIHVVVGDENGGMQKITFAEDKEVDLAVSGPYGLHPTYTEAIDTCYVIYAAWNSRSTPDEDLDYIATNDLAFSGCIFALPSGIAPTLARVTALSPAAGYDSWSKPLGFIANSHAGNIHPFWCSDRMTYVFKYSYGIEKLTEGVEVADTKIDLQGVVPDEAAKFRVVTVEENTDVNARTVNLVLDDAVTPYIAYTSINLRSGAAGYPTMNVNLLVLDMVQPDATDVLSYIWSGAPTGGLTVYVQAVTLFE